MRYYPVYLVMSPSEEESMTVVSETPFGPIFSVTSMGWCFQSSWIGRILVLNYLLATAWQLWVRPVQGKVYYLGGFVNLSLRQSSRIWLLPWTQSVLLLQTHLRTHSMLENAIASFPDNFAMTSNADADGSNGLSTQTLTEISGHAL